MSPHIKLFIGTCCLLLCTAWLPAQEVARPEWLEVPKLDPVEPPKLEDLKASIGRGVEFLIQNQNKDGSWGTAQQTKGLNIYAPVPGAHHAFRTADTALCISALLEDGGDSALLQQALDRGEAWLFEHLPQLRRATPTAIYNVWGHAYAIQALVRMYARLPQDEPRRAKIKQLIESQFDLLQRYESVDGGWGYYDFNAGAKQPTSSSISFVNAAVLVAFHEAQAIGCTPPERLVKRAVAATLRQQKPDFSYLYGEYLQYQPQRGINRPAGSLGRSQACNYALKLWGDEKITNEVLDAWLHRLFARNGWLDIGRKRPIPHESWFQVAGYFYYFGHYYAARCMEELPAEHLSIHQAHMSRLLMGHQEKDGSWWDFPFYNYHQQYGTAFAVMTLHRCLPRPVPSKAPVAGE